MKAIILKDRLQIHAVFVVNDIPERDIAQLQSLAEFCAQEVVVKQVTAVRNLSDMLAEMQALNDIGDDNGDDEG